MFTLKSVQDNVTKIKTSKNKRLKIKDKEEKLQKEYSSNKRSSRHTTNTLSKAILHTSRGRVHISENSFQDFKIRRLKNSRQVHTFRTSKDNSDS